MFSLADFTDCEGAHRVLDLARLDAACPGLRELRVCGAVVQYRPPANTVDTRSFSNLHSLALEEVGGSGDGACWKRTVKRCLSLQCLTLHNIRLANCKIICATNQ